ncbi:MAG: hypothetical protein WAV45_06535 [Propionibacteriaceae bacterium]|nr:hypothetical protein [Micropruina sp.]
MTTIERAEEFADWESKLKKKDLHAAARVTVRVQRLAMGNLNRPGVSGDLKPWEGWSHAREHVEEVSG